MKIKIFHSVNSALYLFDGQTGILLDGLFGPGPYQCFSPFPVSLRKQMIARTGMFAHLDALLFSHAHGDHYDADAVYFLRHSGSPPSCFLSGAADNTLCPKPVVPRITQVQIGAFSIFMLSTAHNGVNPKDGSLFQLPHHVFLIRCCGEQLLIAADGLLGTAEASLLAPFGAIDLMFCNAYHLSAPESLECIQLLKPRRIALYHLPFQEDDIFLYRGLAKQMIGKPVWGAESPFLLPHMAWLDNALPSWAAATHAVFSSCAIHR